MAERATPRLGAFGRWSFIVFMLGLTVLFVVLGVWQLFRLEEKQTLIAAVEERAELAPEVFPAVDQWPALTPEDYNFRPVSVSGRFLPQQSVQVFTALSQTQGDYAGAGYWIMTPLLVEDGTGLVWINRGFVPQDQAERFAAGAESAVSGESLEGLARRPENTGPFTPEPNLEEGRDWVRDPERLERFLAPELRDVPTAPVTIDLTAGPAGTLPQAGETVMRFPNRHLEYAGTWFAFALITPLMLVLWHRRQRKA